MVSKARCASIDAWRTLAVGSNQSGASNTLSLEIRGVGVLQRAVCAELLRSRNSKKIMDQRTLALSSMLTWAIFFIPQVLVINQCVRQKLPKAKAACVAGMEEEIICKEGVDFTDGDKKSENSAAPSSS